MGPIIKIYSPLENGRVLANGEMCRREMYEGFVRCLKGNKVVIMNCTVRGGRAASLHSGYLS
jgi:hypothetical protein